MNTQFRMLSTEPARATALDSTHWAQSAESIRWTQSLQEHRDRIAVAAYYISEARGFAPGHDVEDWLLAQAQIEGDDAASFSAQ
jgi:hypothetical protein